MTHAGFWVDGTGAPPKSWGEFGRSNRGTNVRFLGVNPPGNSAYAKQRHDAPSLTEKRFHRETRSNAVLKIKTVPILVELFSRILLPINTPDP